MTKEEIIRTILDAPILKLSKTNKKGVFISEGALYLLLTEDEAKDILHQYEEYEIEDIKHRLEFKREGDLFNYIDWSLYFENNSLCNYGFTKAKIYNHIYYFTVL